MSRYIDADEFLENESEAYMRAQVSLAKEHADKTIDPTRYVNEAVHKKIQMLINATESADVVEVRHGHWDEDMECSICGCLAPVSHVTGEEYAYDYCPNCGARMDGEDQENE